MHANEQVSYNFHENGANKSVVVTGASGYIGSILVPILLENGYRVRAIDRFFFGDTLPDHPSLKKMRWDVRRLEKHHLEGADALIDLVAISNDPSGEAFREETLAINWKARARAAALAKSAGVKRYVLPSSCSVYGFLDPDQIADESFPTNPLTTYAEANLAAERDVLQLADEGFCVVVLRQATVFGASPRMRFDLAINGMTYGAFTTGKLPLMRDGKQWRPMVHVRDTARAILFMLSAPEERVKGEIFNVGSAENVYQIGPLAEIVAASIPRPVEIEWYGDPDHRSYRVAFGKIEALGWRAEKTAADGVREICELIEAGVKKDQHTITLERYRYLEAIADEVRRLAIDGGDAAAMRLVVLGANGQLGGDIVELARAEGWPVRGLTRADADVTDAQALEHVLTAEPFDVLVNATAFHKTDEVERQPDLAVAVNAEAVVRMMRLCAARGVRFIHFSTDYVFGGDPGRTQPYRETDPCAPVNIYGLSKYYGECLLRLMPGDWTVFRVASLFGRRGASGKGGNFVETMLKVSAEKGILKVVADQIMSPTATRTVARALLAFLRRGAPGGIYHCVNTGQASWYEFACAIIARAGIKAEVVPCRTEDWPTAARRPSFCALNNQKLADIIGPLPSWQEGLEDYLAAREKSMEMVS